MSLVCEACQSLRRPKRSAPPVDSASLAPATSIIQSSSTESTKRRRLESLSVSQDIGKAFTSTVRLTATATSKNALRIQDLIVKDELQRAFLSTFCIDDGWLEEFLPSNKNVCLALHRRGQNSSGVSILVFDQWHNIHIDHHRNTLFFLRIAQ